MEDNIFAKKMVVRIKAPLIKSYLYEFKITRTKHV
jgi:hypothetical protein